jgi:hypothetical protein
MKFSKKSKPPLLLMDNGLTPKLTGGIVYEFSTAARS